MNEERIKQFQKVVWDYYQARGRHDLPWRLPDPGGKFDPYKILVSEVMLQQTQVGRVIPKYVNFLQRFPAVNKLADAPLGEILRVWQGLGYNRRAKFLHQATQVIMRDFGGEFPQDIHELVKLPGVGKNTAAAIYVYSFNKPAAFVETNIRTVFIHHFFKDQAEIPDAAILELVKLTLPSKGKEEPEQKSHVSPDAVRKTAGLSHYREWFWALMDYGVYLKQTVGNLNHASKSYVRQSPLEGSRRQVRGQVLRLLAERPHARAELGAAISDSRLDEVLKMLQQEGLIERHGGLYRL